MSSETEQWQALKEAFRRVLAEDNSVFLLPPMHPDCRVAVLIPAYDEGVNVALRPLLSLARQEKAGKEQYEAVFVVNNSRQEAAGRTGAFLANQKLLQFIRLINHGETSADFLADETAAAREIRRSGLRVYAIDKSSLHTAEDTNYVARARDRGCMEITYRFLNNGRNQRGIIALTDCDCRLSGNYIRSLIDHFNNYDFLNGLCGAIEHEIDQTLPHHQEVKLAFDAHQGHIGRLSVGGRYPNGLGLKKRHGLNYEPLNTGQDIAITVKAWVLSGGVPDRLTGDDYHFGREVESLPGDIGVTDSYTVYPLLRQSHRAGFASYGWRMGKISRSVEDFLAGRSARVLVPDISRQKKLFNQLSQSGRSGLLTADQIRRLFAEHGRSCQSLPDDILQGFADILNQEMTKRGIGPDYARVQNYLLEHFEDFLPQKDITHLFRLSENGVKVEP